MCARARAREITGCFYSWFRPPILLTRHFTDDDHRKYMNQRDLKLSFIQNIQTCKYTSSVSNLNHSALSSSFIEWASVNKPERLDNNGGHQ